ncbi:FAD-dependent monooxygenase [Nonomuraea dietziae]|uniref:FAD-dependent monooxygenase n=1 Tax=Nonomuraea dietziae TaxID=65515 RepID=UPI0033F9D192
MNILISGAGVAGPALAYWLTRHGFTTTVVESAPAPRAGGYAVDFRGPAHLSVLRSMGLLEEIQRCQTHMGAMSYVREDGKRIASMPADLFAGDVEILRGDLATILYEATRDRTEYVFGDSITAVSGSLVTFDKSPPRTFDLVVGADGVHSNVRRLVFGPEEDFVTSLGLHFAIFTVDNYLGLDRTGLLYNTPGRNVGIYSTGGGDAKAVFYFPSPTRDGDPMDLIAEAFEGVGWEAPELLKRMRSADDLYYDSISQVRMERWSRGDVVLLGDAAWCPSPLSGMGTGLAVVGAYVLAGELAQGLDGALDRYEQAMRDYVRGCQKSGESAGRWMVPESRFMAWFLNQNYRLLPYLPWKGMIAKSVRKTAGAVSLKDY